MNAQHSCDETLQHPRARQRRHGVHRRGPSKNNVKTVNAQGTLETLKASTADRFSLAIDDANTYVVPPVDKTNFRSCGNDTDGTSQRSLWKHCREQAVLLRSRGNDTNGTLHEAFWRTNKHFFGREGRRPLSHPDESSSRCAGVKAKKASRESHAEPPRGARKTEEGGS